jgi:hypothetical protein
VLEHKLDALLVADDDLLQPLLVLGAPLDEALQIQNLFAAVADLRFSGGYTRVTDFSDTL